MLVYGPLEKAGLESFQTASYPTTHLFEARSIWDNQAKIVKIWDSIDLQWRDTFVAPAVPLALNNMFVGDAGGVSQPVDTSVLGEINATVAGGLVIDTTISKTMTGNWTYQGALRLDGQANPTFVIETDNGSGTTEILFNDSTSATRGVINYLTASDVMTIGTSTAGAPSTAALNLNANGNVVVNIDRSNAVTSRTFTVQKDGSVGIFNVTEASVVSAFGSVNPEFRLRTSASGTSKLGFRNSGDVEVGSLSYNHTTNAMSLATVSTSLTVTSGGHLNLLATNNASVVAGINNDIFLTTSGSGDIEYRTDTGDHRFMTASSPTTGNPALVLGDSGQIEMRGLSSQPAFTINPGGAIATAKFAINVGGAVSHSLETYGTDQLRMGNQSSDYFFRIACSDLTLAAIPAPNTTNFYVRGLLNNGGVGTDKDLRINADPASPDYGKIFCK